MDWQDVYKASDCKYHEYTNGLDDVVMIGKILRELTAIKDINEATRDQILIWAQRMEVQGVQKEVLDHIREDKEFDSDT